MTLKFGKREYAGGDGDDRDADGPRGANIGGRVSEEQQGSFRQYFIGESDRILENGLAGLMGVGKRAEGEIVSQPGRAQLGPPDGLKISCGNAEDLAAVVQGSDQLADRGAEFRAEIFAVGFDLSAHAGDDPG